MSAPPPEGGSPAHPNQSILESDRHNPYHSATGPATSTAGPHKHNILNKLDPRIDSNGDGSKTVGASSENTAPTTPSRQSTVSQSTSSTTPASSRASHAGSVDTYTTVSPSQTSQHNPSDSLGHSIHNQSNESSPAGFQEGSFHTVSSKDYIKVDSPTSVTAAQSKTKQTSTSAGTSDPLGFRGVPTGSAASHNTADPGMDDHAEDVHTGGRVLGYQPEKESIWTAGAVPGAAPEKEVASPAKVAAHEPTTGLHSQPTESHALATADHDVKGIAQQDHGEVEVKDLGWGENPDHRPAPLVGGLPNEELWVLVRRFDKQMYHVKSTEARPPGGLDLNISNEEEFSPDKLRANLERLYMTVIIGMMGFGKQIVRLRSWGETRRTSSFCAAYFTAWFFDLLTPLMLSLVLVLVVYPRSRAFLFPPAPLALVDGKTGGIKKPSAGMLGSHDSITGAPEKHQGEAVEQEAHNFVTGLSAIGLSSVTGKHPGNATHEKGGVIDSAVPDPSRVAAGASDAQKATKKGDETLTHDKTKEPMEAAMWTKARPVMRALSDLADAWERFANLLSPTPPFPKNTARIRLGGILVPLVGVAIVTPVDLVVKGTTFITGAAFFGDPILSRGLKFLNEKIPNWTEYLDLRNSLLLGVPTNAQLTVTLLRLGEANKAPLPPPPKGGATEPSSTPPALHGDDVPMDVSHDEVQSAIHPSADSPPAHLSDDAAQPAKRKAGARILGLFKKSTKVTVEATLGADRLKATTGSAHAKNRLGVLPNVHANLTSGPVDFKARHHGSKGYVYISTSATTPCVSFTKEIKAVEKAGSSLTSTEKDLDPQWSVAISDIKELKKLGGLGWKVKLVVGWAMDREIADGLEIVDVRGGKWTVTAVPLRDELFNRLVAIGGQKWESW